MARLLIFGVPMMLLLATAAIMLTVLPEEDAPAPATQPGQADGVQQDPVAPTSVPEPSSIPLYEVEWTKIERSDFVQNPDQANIRAQMEERDPVDGLFHDRAGEWFREDVWPFAEKEPWFLTPLFKIKDGEPDHGGGLVGLKGDGNVWIAAFFAPTCFVPKEKCVTGVVDGRLQSPGLGEFGITERMFVSFDSGETWRELVPPADRRGGWFKLVNNQTFTLFNDGETARVSVLLIGGAAYQTTVPTDSPPER